MNCVKDRRRKEEARFEIATLFCKGIVHFESNNGN